MSVKCKGLVVAPGGLGTCDELFEFMTLVQTGKIKHKIPIVLLGKAFWSKVLNFEALVEYGMISEADRDSVNVVDTAEEAMAVIVPKLTALLKAAPKGEHPLR
jgi:predicted Rossmann-fold nucleotide-binding protein